MNKDCCVVGCTNNNTKNNKLSFHFIPNEATEPERREKWLQAIGIVKGVNKTSIKIERPASGSDYHDYVCSDHFISLSGQYFVC